MLVIPAASVGDVIDGFSTDPAYLQSVAGSVTDAALIDAGGRRYVTDAKGRFALDVSPGEYWVCYSWGDAQFEPIAVDVCGAAHWMIVVAIFPIAGETAHRSPLGPNFPAAARRDDVRSCGWFRSSSRLQPPQRPSPAAPR